MIVIISNGSTAEIIAVFLEYEPHMTEEICILCNLQGRKYITIFASRTHVTLNKITQHIHAALKISGTIVRLSLQLMDIKPSFVVHYYIINTKKFWYNPSSS
jgi:hypothetical protein